MVLGLGVITLALFALANAETFALVSASMLLLGLGGLLTPLIGAYLFAGNALQLCHLIAALTAGTFLLHVVTPLQPPTGERGFKISEAGKLAGNPALAMMSLFLFPLRRLRGWRVELARQTSGGAGNSRSDRAPDAVSRFRARHSGWPRGGIAHPDPHLSHQRDPGLVHPHGSHNLGHAADNDPVFADILVFCAGLAMARCSQQRSEWCGTASPFMTATAMGIAITCGWIGLAVSSKIIGAIAGNDSGNLKTALLVLPTFSVLMILVNLLLRTTLRRPIIAN